MKIYANGCSFTYGEELVNPSAFAWPVLVASKMNAEINNDAVSGGTNYRTLYRTIKSSCNNYDLYLIAWTDYSRFTVYKSDNNFEVNFNIQLKNNLYKNLSEFNTWGAMYYKYWYNELYAFKLWLQQIIQLQSILKNKNYLMVNTFPNNLTAWLVEKSKFIESVKSLIKFDLMNDEQIFAEYNEINYYIQTIDLSKFYKWGDFYIGQLSKDFPIGPQGHILEQGHEKMADLIYNHLCSK